MLRFVSCVLLYMYMVDSQGLPLPTLGPNPSSVYPFGVTPPYHLPGVPPVVPERPGARNPYYNRNLLGEPHVPILTYSNNGVHPDGSYDFSFSTADGKQVAEKGFLKNAYIDDHGEPQGTQVVQGSYSYISPEGTPIQVSYIADENGFRPSGLHIPAGASNVLPNILNGNFSQQAYDPYHYPNRPLGYGNNPSNYRYNVQNSQNDAYPYRTPYNPYYHHTPYFQKHNTYNHIYNARSKYDPRYNNGLNPFAIPFSNDWQKNGGNEGPKKD